MASPHNGWKTAAIKALAAIAVLLTTSAGTMIYARMTTAEAIQQQHAERITRIETILVSMAEKLVVIDRKLDRLTGQACTQ